MKSTTKRRLVFSAIALALALLAANALAYRHAYAMTHYAASGARTGQPEALSVWGKARVLLLGVAIPRPTSDARPGDLAADCQTLSIASSDDTTLAAWYVDRGADTPLVVMFHGYAAEKSSLLPEAAVMLAQGYSVMLVDFRGSGESSADYTTAGVREAEDVVAVFAYARDQLPHRRVILYGKSMGAASILRAIALHQVAPDGVIVEAVFDTMLHTVGNRFHAMGLPAFPGAPALVFWGGYQWGFDGFAHNPVDFASRVACPTLLMHGEDDPRATLAEGTRVYDAIPSSKSITTFPGVGHASYVTRAPDRWTTAVAELVTRASAVE